MKETGSHGSPAISRQIAFQAALAAAGGNIAIEDALDAACASRRVVGRDRRLAEEIAYGAVRHRASIDAILAGVSSRPLSEVHPTVLFALRGAVYQAFFLTRVPSHAVVNDAVQLVRCEVGEKPVSFTNAVLRHALRLRAGRCQGELPLSSRRRALSFRDGEHILLADDILPDPAEDFCGWLALHYSYPRWLVAQLSEQLGTAAAEAVLCWGNHVPHTAVRLNRMRVPATTPVALTLENLVRPGGPLEGCRTALPGNPPGCILISFDGCPGNLPGLAAGLFTFQDSSQQEAAKILAPRPGERILDLCAAPGGKATHLAELSGDEAHILACDPDSERLRLVTEAAERLGLRSIRVRPMGVPPMPDELKGRFDAVLADAPCSNTGAMNRRVDARWRANPSSVEKICEIQKGILRSAIQAVAPGGRIAYATCSLLESENGALVRSVISEQSAVRLVREKTMLPERGRSDGSYVALLEP